MQPWCNALLSKAFKIIFTDPKLSKCNIDIYSLIWIIIVIVKNGKQL